MADAAWPVLEDQVMKLLRERTRYWNEALVTVGQSSFGSSVGIRGASAIGLEEWVYGHGAYLRQNQRFLVTKPAALLSTEESYDFR